MTRISATAARDQFAKFEGELRNPARIRLVTKLENDTCIVYHPETKTRDGSPAPIEIPAHRIEQYLAKGFTVTQYPEEETEEDLESMTKDQLLALAAEQGKGDRVNASMTKAEIVDGLLKDEGGS